MKEKIKKYLLFLGIIGLIFSAFNPVFAHPGGTDRYGCHTCRKNCPRWSLSYGEYHCHKSKGLRQPKPPIKSKKLYQFYEINGPDGSYTKSGLDRSNSHNIL